MKRVIEIRHLIQYTYYSVKIYKTKNCHLLEIWRWLMKNHLPYKLTASNNYKKSFKILLNEIMNREKGCRFYHNVKCFTYFRYLVDLQHFRIIFLVLLHSFLTITLGAGRTVVTSFSSIFQT